MKAQYDHNPLKVEAVGNGSSIYRWNIIEKTTPENDKVWECNEVTIWGEVSRQKVTEAVILAIWGVNAEAKLINDYNAANEGILDISYKQVYIDFVTERKSVKEEILNYFESEGL
ncbi:MAG: hypothetical protein HQ522_06870 [Bacteroidetes bacterium]|nr:hypothetical protein [Bacteroidota bacterium]